MKFSDLINAVQKFIRAPSKSPLALTLLTSPFAALITYFSGSSHVGCATLTASNALFLGLKFRNTIYDQPNKYNSSISTSLSEEDGELAATNYSDYMISFFNPDDWRHPIIFGRAMFGKIKENEELIETNKEKEKMKFL